MAGGSQDTQHLAFAGVTDAITAQGRLLDVAESQGYSEALKTMLTDLRTVNAANGGDDEKLSLLIAFMLLNLWGQVSNPGGAI